MRSERERGPVTSGTPQLSEDDSDEGTLHAIIREETERQSARAEREGAGTPELTTTGRGG